MNVYPGPGQLNGVLISAMLHCHIVSKLPQTWSASLNISPSGDEALTWSIQGLPCCMSGRLFCSWSPPVGPGGGSARPSSFEKIVWGRFRPGSMGGVIFTSSLIWAVSIAGTCPIPQLCSRTFFMFVLVPVPRGGTRCWT